MLKRFPLRLSSKVLIAGLLFSIAGYYLVLPMYTEIRKVVIAIHYHYSGVNEEMQSRLEKERTLLAQLERKIVSPANSEKMSAGYYDFIRETLGKRNVQTIKITSEEQMTMNNVQQEHFSVIFTGTYHTIGIIIDDLENGPYHCSVKSLYLLSRSLLKSNLEVALEISFNRLAR